MLSDVPTRPVHITRELATSSHGMRRRRTNLSCPKVFQSSKKPRTREYQPPRQSNQSAMSSIRSRSPTRPLGKGMSGSTKSRSWVGTEARTKFIGLTSTLAAFSALSSSARASSSAARTLSLASCNNSAHFWRVESSKDLTSCSTPTAPACKFAARRCVRTRIPLCGSR